MDCVHSKSGSGAGVSAHGTGCPSKPLNGLLSSWESRWIVPSASPNAIYTAVGDTEVDVTYVGTSSYTVF